MTANETNTPPPVRRVLMVDDHTSLRELWGEMLRLQGYEADVAADGREALDKIAAQTYDAVVCDLHMPRLNGRALFDECLRLHPQIAARFIFISGGWYADVDELCAGTGRPCLSKSFVWDQLHEFLQAVFAANEAADSSPAPPEG